MITRQDIRDQIQIITDAEVGNFDVDAITDELIRNFDLTGPVPTKTIAKLRPDTFWLAAYAHSDV